MTAVQKERARGICKRTKRTKIVSLRGVSPLIWSMLNAAQEIAATVKSERVKKHKRRRRIAELLAAMEGGAIRQPLTLTFLDSIHPMFAHCLSAVAQNHPNFSFF